MSIKIFIYAGLLATSDYVSQANGMDESAEHPDTRLIVCVDDTSATDACHDDHIQRMTIPFDRLLLESGIEETKGMNRASSNQSSVRSGSAVDLFPGSATGETYYIAGSEMTDYDMTGRMSPGFAVSHRMPMGRMSPGFAVSHRMPMGRMSVPGRNQTHLPQRNKVVWHRMMGMA